MNMKKIALLFSAVVLFVLSASAQDLLTQTPEEILRKMSQAMDRGETEGLAVTMEMKIPILGTFRSRLYTRGNKTRMEMKAMGRDVCMWSDEETTWMYDSMSNEVVITKDRTRGDHDSADNLELMDKLEEGYDAKLQKETPEAWYLRCTKRKDNPDKDAPKRMDVAVYKDSYLVMEMSASVKGITVVMKEFSLDVSEEDVTFDMARYPDAGVTDER